MKTPAIIVTIIAVSALAIGYAQAETITGCLKGPNSEGVYELTNTQQKGEVEVGGSSELSAHVGHTVKLTGQWVKSGADIGEKETAGKEDTHEHHFKVSAVEHIAAGCSK